MKQEHRRGWLRLRLLCAALVAPHKHSALLSLHCHLSPVQAGPRRAAVRLYQMKAAPPQCWWLLPQGAACGAGRQGKARQGQAGKQA